MIRPPTSKIPSGRVFRYGPYLSLIFTSPNQFPFLELWLSPFRNTYNSIKFGNSAAEKGSSSPVSSHDREGYDVHTANSVGPNIDISADILRTFSARKLVWYVPSTQAHCYMPLRSTFRINHQFVLEFER